jgi:hypothetical protein
LPLQIPRIGLFQRISGDINQNVYRLRCVQFFKKADGFVSSIHRLKTFEYVTFFPRKKVTKEIFPEIKTLPAQASLPTGVAFLRKHSAPACPLHTDP